ncbi:MAG: hypothetical protein ACOC7K_01515 [bacterium]
MEHHQLGELICYLGEVGKGQEISPGFCMCTPAVAPQRRGWLRLKDAESRTMHIVYRQHFPLHWDDLELVAFVPQGRPQTLSAYRSTYIARHGTFPLERNRKQTAFREFMVHRY